MKIYFVFKHNHMLLTVGEIIQNSWELCKKNWRVFGTYAILLLLPSIALTAVGFINIFLTANFPSFTAINNIISLALFAASLVFGFWVAVALSISIKNALENKITEWKKTMKDSLKIIWPALLITVLSSIIIGAGILLLIIPGVIFMVWYAFSFYEVIFENKKTVESLRASKNLTVGRWWSVALRLAAPSLFYGLIAMLIGYALISILQLITNYPLAVDIGIQFISNAINVLFAPITSAAIIILYKNIKENPVASSAIAEPPKI